MLPSGETCVQRLWKGVMGYDDYFKCKYDALGKVGFSSYQKCTIVVRMLAHGIPDGLLDEYVCMSESTCLASLYKFCKAVVECLARSTCQNTMPRIQSGCWRSMNTL